MSLRLPVDRNEAQGLMLRPYQERMVASWLGAMDRGVRRGLIVAATGTGKTTVFSAVLRAMAEESEGFSALVLAHRQELLDQAAGRISLMGSGLRVATHSGSRRAKEGADVVVGSVQALGAAKSTALDWMSPDLVIVDEAHHAAARTYQNVFRRFGCYDDVDGTYLLGVTATPHRMDNLSLHGTNGSIFEELVFKYDIVQAIKDGFLVDLRGYRAVADYDLSRVKTVRGDYQQSQLQQTMNTEAVTSLAFDSWAQVAADRSTIVFCSGVEHAKNVADRFNLEGIRAAAVYGEMGRDERGRILRDFQEGRIQVLTNMDVLTEGYDAQHCSAILLLRPTQSWSLFAQMVGRGLRCLPNVIEGVEGAAERRRRIGASGKADCIVIDIVGNTRLHEVGKAAPEEGAPSLQALVGLPTGLELEGRSLGEAVDEFGGLPDYLKAAAFRRKTTFSGLTGVLTQVEMISELDIPDEAVEQEAKLYWLKIGEGCYVLDIGGRGADSKGRICRLDCDVLGNWTLTLASAHRPPEQWPMGNVMNGVFARAEARVKEVFFGVSRLAARDARWRGERPTEGQVAFLREKGIDDVVIEQLDQGKASALVTMMERSV